MRKILLGTTAVVGLALAAPAAFAQSSLIGQGPHGGTGSPAVATSGLSVRLGGFFDFSYGTVSDDADKSAYRSNPTGGVAVPGARSRSGSDFRTESEINLYVDGTAANGLRYGAVFELQMDGTAGTTVDYDELYGFVKGAWGELRFGQEDAAASLINVGAPGTLWQGYSGAAWDEFVTANPAAVAPAAYGLLGGTAPYLLTSPFDGGDATKIIYLSPQFNGFDFAVSYAVNAGEGERQDTQRDRITLDNQMSGAIRYRGTMGPVGVQASFTASQADAPALAANGQAGAAFEKFSAYSGGIILSAMGFSVGGEYVWGNFANNVAAAQREGLAQSKHIQVGATYTIGDFMVGLQYGEARQDNGVDATGAQLEDRIQTVLSVGTQYVVAPGMTLFSNWTQVADKNIPTAAPVATNGRAAATARADFGGGDFTRNINVFVAGVRVAF